MTTEQILSIVGAVAVALGPIGSLLEMLGEAKKWPKLVRVAQSMESLSLDVPKLLRGSRFTNATVADIAKKVEQEK